MTKIKNNTIPLLILWLIYACLLFAMYISVSTLALGLWGQTTMGTVDSYESRLDNSTARQNRSRTISKGYYFTVNAKQYSGYVIYASDEAWPRLAKGETRTERIRYLPFFPYINKPNALSDFDEMGALAIMYHLLAPLAYLFLLMLVTGTVKQQKKTNKRLVKQASHHPVKVRSNAQMFCTNCGNQLSDDAQFCSNCGLSTQPSITRQCTSCGEALAKDALFCTHCGTRILNAAADRNSQAKSAPEPDFPNFPARAGFSDYYDHPEILAAARKNRKTGIGCMWVLTLVPLIGFPLAGLWIESLPFTEAVVIGVGIALVMFIVNLFALRRASRPMWEGVVEDKTRQERSERRSSEDSSYSTYIEYTTVIRTQDGKKKKIVEKDSSNHMYDYLSVGDRVRYHPAFGTYEKYDKSKDKIIYCNVCSMMNPIKNDRCKRCDNLLFK